MCDKAIKGEQKQNNCTITGYFEKEPGNKSMMRLLSFLSFIIGTVEVQ